MTRASERSYREQALKIYPWICGRCAREFTHANMRELTVHSVDPERNLLLVKGAVPGPKNGLVEIREDIR